MIYLILLSSLWVLYDAHKIGARKGLIKGIADIGPVAWFVVCLFLWIIGFPMYLIKRSEIKAAATSMRPPAPGLGTPPPLAMVPAIDNLVQLEKLGELKNKGIITDEEFRMKKKQLLG